MMKQGYKELNREKIMTRQKEEIKEDIDYYVQQISNEQEKLEQAERDVDWYSMKIMELEVELEKLRDEYQDY